MPRIVISIRHGKIATSIVIDDEMGSEDHETIGDGNFEIVVEGRIVNIGTEAD